MDVAKAMVQQHPTPRAMAEAFVGGADVLAKLPIHGAGRCTTNNHSQKVYAHFFARP